MHVLRAEGLTVAQIAKQMGVSRATIYRRLGTEPEDPRDGADEAELEPGPLERAVGALVAGRELDLPSQATAVEALALARKADELGRTSGAGAG
ncbi:MAG: helix-turn-helix domain-containing protein, partial [Trebonia sp.]